MNHFIAMSNHDATKEGMSGRIEEIMLKGEAKFNKSLTLDIKRYLGIDFDTYDHASMIWKTKDRIKMLKSKSSSDCPVI